MERLAGVDRPETALRRALRLGAIVGIFSALGLLVMMPFQGDASQWLTVARIPSVLAPLFMAALIFFGTLIVHAMWRAMYGPHGRSWVRVFGVAFAAWLFVPVATLVVCVPFSGPSLATVDEVLPLLLFGVPAPIALILVTRFAAPELRLAAEWANLDIDAQNGAAA